MISIISRDKDKEQVKWVDASSKVGERKYLADDAFEELLAVNSPLWVYITEEFPLVAHDPMSSDSYLFKKDYPIQVIGYQALPTAIELSQWGYKVTFISSDLDVVEQSKYDAEKQGGLINKFMCMEFEHGVPESCIIVASGVLEPMKTSRILPWVKYLTTRASTVLLSVEKEVADWHKLLAPVNPIIIWESTERIYFALRK